ncbi:hypothetical protein ACI51Z_09300 [Pectobacterium carotovorum]|uniref:hypothetical protein n=1 Tax=Pectobacterium carotovorum TaxID=554 RepID=UPI003864E820
MKLEASDANTIAAYFRLSGYNGPIFLCLQRLKELHMPLCELITRMAIEKAKSEGEKQ